MAHMVDQKPVYNGEGLVWESFKNNLPDDIVVYNNREVKGKEFDYCLLMKNKGILIVEVKGWRFEQVTVHNPDRIEVTGFSNYQTSPKKQARMYRFNLLNKIKEKYNCSPLVFDMVCYPFITEDEYIKNGLNTVCESEYVFFKEDLLSQKTIVSKLNKAYDSMSNVIHQNLDDFMFNQVRSLFEKNTNSNEGKKENVYSITKICPNPLTTLEINEMIRNYFNGSKIVLFLQDQSNYEYMIDSLEQKFKMKNISINHNDIIFGKTDSFRTFKLGSELKIFNCEVYHCQSTNTLTNQEFTFYEGNVDTKEKQELLKKLATLTSFNYQQYEIEHSDSNMNVLVMAGAGTGKTYSMISRISYLCNKQENYVSRVCDEIAMVTFTNEAANNMKKRLKQLYINYALITSNAKYHEYIRDVDRANICTIHKFSLTLLKKLCIYTGLGTNFQISKNQYLRKKKYDEYLEQYFQKKNEDESFDRELNVPVYKLKNILMKLIDSLLNKSVDMFNVKEEDLGESPENAPYFNELLLQVAIPAEIAYFNAMHDDNKIDLQECIILIKRVLEQNQIKHVDNMNIRYLFIDEFQDTDDIQIELFSYLQKIIGSNTNLFVVGDLKQSIYRFRGAKLSAFEKLQTCIEDNWQTFSLNINYRSDQTLLHLYETVFEGMGEQGTLPYTARDVLYGVKHNEDSTQQTFLSIPTHRKDEKVYYDTLMKCIEKEVDYIKKSPTFNHMNKADKTIAILVRNNYEIAEIVLEGKMHGINIKTNNGGNLFKVSSTLDLYKLILALQNNKSTLHLVNFIESNYINLDLNYSLMISMSEEEKLSYVTNVLNEYFLQRFTKTWEQIIEETFNHPILYMLKILFEGLKPWQIYSDYLSEQKQYIANYEYLLESVITSKKFEAQTLNTIEEYLRINITTEQLKETHSLELADDTDIEVLCSTIHKSKGLEYGVVILPNTAVDISDSNKEKLSASYIDHKLSYFVLLDQCNSIYNSNYSMNEQLNEQIEEETRILYVAMTRAIRKFIWFKDLDTTEENSWAAQLEV